MLKQTLSSSCVTGFELLEGRRLLSTVVGLTANNQLVQFDTSKPSYVYNQKTISGLRSGDKVVGIDYRPADGKLYGVVDGATQDRIVRIDPGNGYATGVFALTTALNGTKFGVDFNPVADAVRITSDFDQNLRVPFATGVTNVDGMLNYNPNDINAGTNPNVVSSAYSNSFPGTTATVLYDVDSLTDSLTIQNPPNAGTLVTRGPLGVDTTALVGFDIQASTSSSTYGGQAYVSLKRSVDSGSRLYRIDLASGSVRDSGAIGGTSLLDITLKPSSSTYSGGYNGGYYGGYNSGSYSNNTYSGSNSSYSNNYNRDSYDSRHGY